MTADIVTNDQISKAEQYKPLIVGYHNGLAVHLSDVADVTGFGAEHPHRRLTNGIPSVRSSSSASRAPISSRPTSASATSFPFLQAVMPQGIKATVVLDRTTTIKASLHDVESSLIISVVLVILVVFVFLRNARATLIPSVAVPVSLIGTFAVMYLLGYSLDNLSLMALTISTGFVVDDAIVVMENISRYLEMGMPPAVAALRRRKGDRLYRADHEHVADRRVHPAADDGRHRRPALPRVRRYPLHRHPGLHGDFVNHHPDDVRSLAQSRTTERSRAAFIAPASAFLTGC